MKRILSILLCAIITLGLTACGLNNSGVKTYNVGVAIYKYDDNFMTLYRGEIESYFKTLETDNI